MLRSNLDGVDLIGGTFQWVVCSSYDHTVICHRAVRRGRTFLHTPDPKELFVAMIPVKFYS